MAWDQFFAMGKYAEFVWPAYGLSALVLVVLLVTSLRYLKSQQRILRRLEPSETEHRRETQT